MTQELDGLTPPKLDRFQTCDATEKRPLRTDKITPQPAPARTPRQHTSPTRSALRNRPGYLQNTRVHSPHYLTMVAESNNNEVARVAEPLLDANDDRFTMFPIKYGDIWEMYKKAEASFWTGTSHLVTTRYPRSTPRRSCPSTRRATRARPSPDHRSAIRLIFPRTVALTFPGLPPFPYSRGGGPLRRLGALDQAQRGREALHQAHPRLLRRV